MGRNCGFEREVGGMLCINNSWAVLLAIVVMASSCGSGTHIESIQVLPLDPTILSNNTVYVLPGTTVQYQIQGWYSNNTVQTINSSQGIWSSTNPSIATVDSNGLATSVGPIGSTTIIANVSGHKSTVVLAVCNVPGACPPLL
jgi:hypothetical protein